jgi:hypothetical protein
MRLAPVMVVTVMSAASSACGQYSWPDRPLKVPTRALVVHENAFLAPPGSVGGDPCAASAMDLTLAGCRDACGPIRVLRDGEPFVSLLTPPPVERAPVPAWARPGYSAPPTDGSREKTSVPLGSSVRTIGVQSSCPLRVEEPSAAVEVQETPGALGLTLRDVCSSLSVKLVCR